MKEKAKPTVKGTRRILPGVPRDMTNMMDEINDVIDVNTMEVVELDKYIDLKNKIREKIKELGLTDSQKEGLRKRYPYWRF